MVLKRTYKLVFLKKKDRVIIMKKKVGICGFFGEGEKFNEGQSVKTKSVTEELINRFGYKNLQLVNTYGWKKRPIKLLLECIMLMKNCENIVILPAHKGVKVFLPMYSILNLFFKRKIHYIVIGGWLPDLINKNKWLLLFTNKINGIYVETNIMREKLKKFGLENVFILPNFKKIRILRKEELNYNHSKPFKLCTFSRVIKEKGIEDAINAVTNINKRMGEIIFTLDIYGLIDENYKEEFEKICNNFPDYINYCGVVEHNRSVDVLKDYFLLLFPTRYKTEGIPGTIIDSYCAGVPILCSKWDNFNEVIENGITGFGFELGNYEEFEEKLYKIALKPEKILKLKKNCIRKAKDFLPVSAMKNLINNLE